ncbi:MAG: hypothetical protein U0835_12765 [Isosphaeraceae bacterium]
MVRLTLGCQCPVCSRWTLRRLARNHRHFECSACGSRVKQSWLGRWHDASGPEDAPVYHSRKANRPWEGFAVPSAARDTTVGQLLSSQRERRPLPVTPDDAPDAATEN